MAYAAVIATVTSNAAVTMPCRRPGPSPSVHEATAMTCSLESPPTVNGTPARDTKPSPQTALAKSEVAPTPLRSRFAVDPASTDSQPTVRNSSALKIACENK